MKVEIEIPDLEELYYMEEETGSVTGKDIKKFIVDLAVEKIVDKLYDDYVYDRAFTSIKNDISNLVKENSAEIIERVVTKVATEIERKKAIVEQMPKKSEVTAISKEWEEYFIELIDKAIAKRFK